MKKLNNHGAALIMAYFVMSIFVILAVGIAMTAVTELNGARRYHDLTTAFWLAESAVSRYLHDPKILDDNPKLIIEFEKGQAELSKLETVSALVVTATGFSGGSHRTIEIKFPAISLEVFNNAISVSGDIVLDGQKVNASFYNKTRLSGQIVQKLKYGQAIFEDKQENYPASMVSLNFPDANQNGTGDEFDDFVLFQQNLIKNYSPKEVLYVKSNDTLTITPASQLKGKKIIYVEGQEGTGSVQIQLGASLDPGQNLTVISTGTVSMNYAENKRPDSQLNVISWSGYEETSPIGGTHQGMIFTHGTAVIDDVYDQSVSYGGLVANGGLKVGEVWSNKSFYYMDTRQQGAVPPGFEGLLGGGVSGYAETPNSWKEI